MYNLSGNPNTSNFIRKELEEAGIEIIQGEVVPCEVKTNLTGKLGEFTFKRAWYYWIVNGPVSLDVANEMYATKIGKEDVRVAGHAGCPPPKEWALPSLDNVLLDELKRLGIETITISDIRTLSNAPMFVSLYHIDSQKGLNLFVETIKKHDLI